MASIGLAWGNSPIRACHYCGAPISRMTATKDHKTPLARGGRDEPRNLVWSCRPCNAAKGSGSYTHFKTLMLPVKAARAAGQPLPEVKIERDPQTRPMHIAPELDRDLKAIAALRQGTPSHRAWSDLRIAEHLDLPVDLVADLAEVASMRGRRLMLQALLARGLDRRWREHRSQK